MTGHGRCEASLHDQPQTKLDDKRKLRNEASFWRRVLDEVDRVDRTSTDERYGSDEMRKGGGGVASDDLPNEEET